MTGHFGDELPDRWQCPWCGSIKPDTSFYREELGYCVTICKECRELKYAPEPPPKVPGRNKGLVGVLWCASCGVQKPLGAFAKDKNRNSGHYPRCKKCVSEQMRERRALNKARSLLNKSTPTV